MNDHCGQTGLVPHEYIMEVFKRGGENLIKEMKGYVDENSKKWLEIERQKREWAKESTVKMWRPA